MSKNSFRSAPLFSGYYKEFDSLDELRQFDGRYLVNADSAIIDNICETLKVYFRYCHQYQTTKDG